MEYIFLLSRIIFGGYFLFNGVMHFVNNKGLISYAEFKKVPLAKISVFASGVVLILGGLGILLWAYVPVAVLLLVLFLVVTSIMMHNFWKITDPTQKMSENVAFMKNMALIGGALAFFWLAYFVR